jgi:hypothetical protein
VFLFEFPNCKWDEMTGKYQMGNSGSAGILAGQVNSYEQGGDILCKLYKSIDPNMIYVDFSLEGLWTRVKNLPELPDSLF